MAFDAHDLLQLAAILGGLVIFAILLQITVSASNGRRRRYEAAWFDRARRLGFHVSGSFSHDLALKTVVDGLHCVITTRRETSYHGRNNRYRRVETRAVLRAAPMRWSDAAVLRETPQFFGVGHLTEVPLEPAFPYRTFGARPNEVHQWFPPPTRLAVATARSIASISLQAGILTMVLDGVPADPRGLVAAVEIARSIHHGASPCGAPVVITSRPLIANVHVAALAVAVLVSCSVGFAMPWSDSASASLSALACEEGDLEIVGSKSKQMRCGEWPATRPASLLAFPAMAAACATPVLLVTYLLALGVGKMTARHADDL
jgi:hypothetical protein